MEHNPFRQHGRCPLLYISSNVGLFSLGAWARIGFTVGCGLGWIYAIVSPHGENSFVVSAFGAIIVVCEVVLLILMWTPPLRGRFRRLAKPMRADDAPFWSDFRDHVLAWPHIGRMALASLSAMLVGTAAAAILPTAVPALTMIRGSDDASVAMILLPYRVLTYLFGWAAFWFAMSFVIFPVVQFTLVRGGYTSRWARAAIGIAAPFAAMFLLEIVAPQFGKRDFVVVPICGGIPAALIFGEIARLGAPASGSRRGSPIAAAISFVSLLGLIVAAQQAWSMAKGFFPVKAEIQYRLRHPEWPVLCLGVENVRLFPRIDPRSSDAAICKADAQEGDAVAELMAADGKFGPVTPAEREAWLTKAAEQDYGPADAALATMLTPSSKDEGVPKDATKAAQWKLRAAIAGDTISRAMVAIFYEKGDRGLPQDMVASLMWRELTFLGNPDRFFRMDGFREVYQKFAAKAPPEQVAEAHRRALEFIASH